MRKLLTLVLFLVTINCYSQRIENYDPLKNEANIEKIIMDDYLCIIIIRKLTANTDVKRTIYIPRGCELNNAYMIDEATLMGVTVPKKYHDGNLKKVFEGSPNRYYYLTIVIKSAWERSKQ